MPKLSIDIGVDLKDSLSKLNGLKSALMDVEKTANNLVSSLQKINGVKINPKVGDVTGGGPTQPKATKLPDIFADYNSGAFKASSLTDFLEAKLTSLQAEANKLRTTLSQTQDTGVYTATLQKLKEVESQIKRTTAALGAQAPSVRNTTSSYTVFNAALDKQRQVANLANLSLVNVGRVFQDLPFGILGVANNINPLVEGFSQLSSTAKSTGQSIGKVLLSSLLGPGGLAVGFSLVTAALSFASVGLSYWNRESSKTKKETNELSKALKAEKDALNQLASGIASDAVKINGLVNAYKDNNITLEERKRILNELKSVSPEYFNSLSSEKTSVNDLVQAYDRYNQGLLDSLNAKVLVRQAEDIITKIIELENTQSQLIRNKQFRLIEQGEEQNLNAYQQFQKGTLGLTKDEVKTLEDLKKQRDDLLQKIKDTTTAIKDSNKESLKAKKEKKEELTDQQKFALAIAEIRADIEKIRSKPLLTDAEKNLAIASSLKSGLDKLADDFPKQFKASLFKVGGDVRQFTDELSKTELKVLSDTAISDAEKLQTILDNIATDESLLDTDKTQKALSEVNKFLDIFRQKKDELLATPFRLEGLPQFSEAFVRINGNISLASRLLTQLGEKARQLKLGDIFRKYQQDIAQAASESKLNLAFADILGTSDIDEQIKFVRDKIQTAFSSLKLSLNINKGKESPISLFFRKVLEQSGKDLEKLIKEKELNDQLQKLASSVNDTFVDAFANIFEAIGNIAGGQDAGEAFSGVFAGLTEGLGRALIQFAKDSAKVKAAIETIKNLLPKEAGWGAILGALALGGLLVAASKLQFKGFADGGFVSGPGGSRTDSIPARLSNGEYVINANSVRKYGKGFFDRLNAGTGSFNSQFGGALRFADGGLVDSLRQFGRNGGSATALVNRTDDMGGFIAETKISGQDLRLVLKRADSRFSNVT